MNLNDQGLPLPGKGQWVGYLVGGECYHRVTLGERFWVAETFCGLFRNKNLLHGMFLRDAETTTMRPCKKCWREELNNAKE